MRPLRALLAGAVFAVLAVVTLSMLSDLPELLAAISRASLLPVAAALGLALANYVIRAAKWLFLLRWLGQRDHAKTAIAVFFAGLSMSMTPGKLGELLKAMLLKDCADMPVSATAPAVLADRLADLLSLLLLLAGGVFALGYGLDVVLVTLALCAMLMAAVLLPPARRLLLGLAARVPGLQRHGQALRNTLDNSARLFLPLPMLVATALSCAAWFAECLAFFLILSDLGIASSLFQAVFIYGLGTLAGAVSMLPGGLIATEGSMFFLLTAFFRLAAQGPAGAAILIVRFCTLWFAEFLGIAVLLFHKGFRRSIFSRGAFTPAP